jgi:hypothetical protein
MRNDTGCWISDKASSTRLAQYVPPGSFHVRGKRGEPSGIPSDRHYGKINKELGLLLHPSLHHALQSPTPKFPEDR